MQSAFVKQLAACSVPKGCLATCQRVLFNALVLIYHWLLLSVLYALFHSATGTCGSKSNSRYSTEGKGERIFPMAAMELNSETTENDASHKLAPRALSTESIRTFSSFQNPLLCRSAIAHVANVPLRRGSTCRSVNSHMGSECTHGAAFYRAHGHTFVAMPRHSTESGTWIPGEGPSCRLSRQLSTRPVRVQGLANS